METTRAFLRSLGLPGGDAHALPASPKRFPDGAQYRVEIPSTEGPRCLAAVIEEADRYGLTIHRISQGSGVFLQTDDEIREMADLGRARSMEVCLFARPNAGWDTSASGDAVADDKVVRSGRWSARIDRSAGSAGPFTTLTKSIPLDVAGKTIVLRGFLRTDEVTGFVALWLREDGSGTSSLAFDTTQNRQIKGTNDWQEHSVTVPVHAEGRQLVFGVLISGTGKVWADDLELQVDGAPFAAAPKVERPKTVLDTDQEFDAGSRIAFDTLTDVQIDNLTTLGKVWGFVKYHHPQITSGSRHWDYDLLRVLPGILAATDRTSGASSVTAASVPASISKSSWAAKRTARSRRSRSSRKRSRGSPIARSVRRSRSARPPTKSITSPVSGSSKSPLIVKSRRSASSRGSPKCWRNSRNRVCGSSSTIGGLSASIFR